MNTENLYITWQKNWANMKNNEKSAKKIITSIDGVREEIRYVLQNLD